MMRNIHSVVLMAAIVCSAAVLAGYAAVPPAIEDGRPLYDAAGRLILPANYREWIFVSAGLDMNYSRNGAAPTAHVFSNVFVPRATYARFKATGHWPDKTILILENRAGSSRGSINRSGQFQTGNLVGLEAHVRDAARFRDGWGFFAFDGSKPAELIGYEASCYGCHRANAAVDTTFVQFYPTLLLIATSRGSLTPSYRANPLAIVP